MQNQLLGSQVFQNAGATAGAAPSSDVAGLLTFASGSAASVAYHNAYNFTPVVILTPVNPGAATFVLSTTSKTGFTVGSTGAAGKTVNWCAIGNPS
jgi:hypothetical protein